jgi:thiamine-phosphate pyrophosphorylase
MLRVLDAAANRAQEALRVVEDYTRLVLDDGHLTKVCKDLRHELAAALVAIPFDHRLAARETLCDVGTVLDTSSEWRRDDAGSVLRANFARLEQSLRSLEEFGKLFDENCARQIKQLRYRVYTLQRAAEITGRATGRLASARLYALIDGRPSLEDFQRLARALIGAGAAVVQLRDKQLDDRALLTRGRFLAALTGAAPPAARTLWVMNDRPDLAALACADGVHLGQEDVTVKDARRIVGPDRLIGVSTHSLEQARQAVLDGADYIGVGPTFPSGTKQFDRLPGLELLREVAAEIRLPAFAIGGISPRNVAEVLAAGFTRIAVSGAVLSSDDPGAAVRELKKMMKDEG